MKGDIFYRVETGSTKEFLAGPHISEPIEGAGLTCPRCNGEGEVRNRETGEWEPCELCGWLNPGQISYDPENPEHREAYRREGVSCFRTPEEVIDYFNGWQAVCPIAQAEVVKFEGEAIGIGLDDEPLAIPAKVLRRWMWTEFEEEFGE